jgi:hypothetical protein
MINQEIIKTTKDGKDTKVFSSPVSVVYCESFVVKILHNIIWI